MASVKKRADGSWRARYRDDQDREHAKHFDRKVDGEKWLAAQTTAVATGGHVVPRLSKITVQSFYDDWFEPSGLGVRHPHRDGSLSGAPPGWATISSAGSDIPTSSNGQTDGRPTPRRRND